MAPDEAAGGLISDVVYDDVHGLSLDLHLAPSPDSSPVVLYAHGGGFAHGAKDSDEARISTLAQLGLTIATIDYRLAPIAGFPDPIDDVRAAARFLQRKGTAFGLPTSRLGAIGASAGGYLVAMAALHEETPFAAVSPWFAPSDLWMTSRRSALEGRISPPSFEVTLLGDLSDGTRTRQASPLHQDLTNAPPFLLLHGDSDRVVHPYQSEDMHRALTRAGRSSTLIIAGNAGHEDAQFDDAPLLAAVASWFRTQLNG